MLNNTAPVTVVIPCWRCISTIERAVNSIQQQTSLPEKVILIDDASGDGTADFLDHLKNKYEAEWIEVIKLNINSGPGPARNAGWHSAKTPYIAFLDADDAWHPQKVELQLNWMLMNPDIVITGHASELYEEDRGFKEINVLNKPRVYTLLNMLISNRMITRSVMVKADISFKFAGKDVTEDYLLWLEISATNIPIIKFDAPLAVSFRPEFSAGGYSANLWRHERRELKALNYLRSTNKINGLFWVIFSSWSIVKFARRLIINELR